MMRFRTSQPRPAYCPSGAPLACCLNNCWVFSNGAAKTPNLINPGNPMSLGNAALGTGVSKFGFGLAKTATNFTNIATATGTAAWSTVIGLFRLRASGTGVGLFGNVSDIVSVDGSGHLNVYLSSGNRCTGAATLAAQEAFVLGFRNDSTNGYELYYNGKLDGTGSGGWGVIPGITFIGTGSSGAQNQFECYGLFTFTRFLSAADHLSMAVNPWQVFPSKPISTLFAPTTGVAGFSSRYYYDMIGQAG